VSRRSRHRAAAVALLAALTGCGAATASFTSAPDALDLGADTATSLRLGYLPNLTHAPAIVGLEKGFLKNGVGQSVSLQTQTFNAGPDEITALFGGALDAAFIGPNPAINGFVKSHGDALRIVAGATAGGAALVVQSGRGISAAADLRGKTIATPQLGNTQDVALRAWLKRNGITTDAQGGGDVKIAPTDNATTLQLFKAGQIDGAWVPEPWATRLVIEGKGTVLVDEAGQWPSGRFVTTELIVSRTYLTAHPATVRHLIEGELAAVTWINGHAAEAETVVNSAIGAITGKNLAAAIIDAAWTHLSFGLDPLAGALNKAATDAQSVGLLGTVDLKGIVDLRILNDVLAKAGAPAVDAAGLQT
jgi:NitT/TauT family transport system substrate-binding protein